jgi:Glycosyltransferase sugar-binding region containing DXD motif
VIVQFWDNRQTIPPDVAGCIRSWAALESQDYQHVLYDDDSAADFIDRHLSDRHLRAFQSCPHPAMRSDFFSYAFIWSHGGYYVDADDEYLGGSIARTVRGNGLHLRPLCYDITSDQMIDAGMAAAAASDAPRVFYVDTTPIIAPAKHPIVGAALSSATENILGASNDNRDIQTLTGPGNLTASLVRHAIELTESSMPPDFSILDDWNSVAVSKWPLSYRSDQRNWRLWQRRAE